MNADKLVIRCKARAFIPETSSFTADSILDEINTALRTLFAPMLLQTNGEYFTETVDLTPDSSGNVLLPEDSISNTARVLTWVDSNGQESSPLRRIEQGDIGNFSSTGYSYSASPTSFALTPDGAKILGFVAGSGAVRCRYSRRPGELVAGTHTQVLAVTAVTAGVSFAASSPDGLPAWNTGVWDGVDLDLTLKDSPFRRKALDSHITHIASTDVWTYTGSMVSKGDVLTIPGTSYMPQAPTEWHDILMDQGASLLANLRKDYALEANRLQSAQRAFDKLLNAAQPRTKQNPKVLSAWAGRTINSRGNT